MVYPWEFSKKRLEQALIVVISEQRNWEHGKLERKSTVFSHGSFVLFECVPFEHGNIIFTVTKSQKPHLANECTYEKKKIPAYKYRFKKHSVPCCVLERMKTNVASVQKASYPTR